MKDCLLLSIARLNRSTPLGPQLGPLRLGEEGFGFGLVGSGKWKVGWVGASGCA